MEIARLNERSVVNLGCTSCIPSGFAAFLRNVPCKAKKGEIEKTKNQKNIKILKQTQTKKNHGDRSPK